MADLAPEEILREIQVADGEKVRARNYVLGRFGFTDGVADRSKKAETALLLRMLGLDWRVPPGTLPVTDMPSTLEVDPKSRGLRSRHRRQPVR